MMHPFTYIFHDGFVVFGTALAVVLTVARFRLLYGGRRLRPVEPREMEPVAVTGSVAPMVSTPVALPMPALVHAAVHVAPLRSLLDAAVAEAFVEPGPVDDREDLLRRLSVNHLQAAHPMFRPGDLPVRRQTPSPAARPGRVVRHGRPGLLRGEHAPLRLVRTLPTPVAPLA